MALADPGNHRLLLVHPDGSDPSSPDDDSDGKDRTSKHGHVLIKPWMLGLCLLGAFLSGVVASTGMQYTGAVAGAILSRRLAERIANLRLRHRRDGCGGPNQQVRGQLYWSRAMISL